MKYPLLSPTINLIVQLVLVRVVGRMEERDEYTNFSLEPQRMIQVAAHQAQGSSNNPCDFVARARLGHAYVTGSSQCTGENCSGIFWRDSTKSFVVQREGKTTLPISCADAFFDSVILEVYQLTRQGTGHTGRVTTRQPRESRRAKIHLHYHGQLDDPRPRLMVSFMRNPNLNPTPFSMFFDTGASRSFILSGMREDGKDGLLTGSNGERVEENLLFGDDYSALQIEIREEIDETVNLGDSFSFPLRISVASTCSDPYIGTGLFAAGSSSGFAKAAGVFAYRPPPKRHDPYNNHESAGSLLIGQHKWSDYCRSKITRVKTVQHASSPHWIVPGYVSLPHLGNRRSVPLDWIVDTGAASTYMTEEAYMVLVEAIAQAGAQVLDLYPTSHNRVANCISRKQYFPNLRLSVGLAPGLYSLELPPDSYLAYFETSDDSCYLTIDYTYMFGMPTTGLLGMDFLTQAFTYFDAENAEMGFCLPRN